MLLPNGRARRVAIAVRTWASDESVYVWKWMKKYFIETGEERDWLYIVHINTGRDKGDWKAPGPLIPALDRALQEFSYNIVDIPGESAASAIVSWAHAESIDVIVLSAGKSKRGVPHRLIPIASRTTDHVITHAPCSTLVVNPMISLADITRCHLAQDDMKGVPISDCRRVAIAHQEQEAIQSLQQWSSTHCSRPDDIEFSVLINRKSMLARVNRAIRPRTRRLRSLDASGSPPRSSNGATSLEAAAVPSASGAPQPTPGSASANERANVSSVSSSALQALDVDGVQHQELHGKPTAVIKRFVTDHNIDLLIISCRTASGTMRRYHTADGKAALGSLSLKPSAGISQLLSMGCACLFVPTFLLPLRDGIKELPPAIFSEDELGGEDDSAPLKGSRMASLTPPTALPVAVNTSNNLPDAVTPTPSVSKSIPSILVPASPVSPRGSSRALDASLASEYGTPSGRSAEPGSPTSAAAPRGFPGSTSPQGQQQQQGRGSEGSNLQGLAASAAAASEERGMLTTIRKRISSTLRPGARNSVDVNSAAPGGGGGSSNTSAVVAPGSVAGTPPVLMAQMRRFSIGDRDRGAGSSMSGSAAAPSQPTTSAFPLSTVSSDAGNQGTSPLSNTSSLAMAPAELLSSLADLEHVLREGGLSADMRSRGADSVASARALVAELTAELEGLRVKNAATREKMMAALADL